MDIDVLLQIPLFENVPSEDLKRIFSDPDIRETPFRRGEILARQGETCNRLILLLSGSVKGEMFDPSDHMVKVEDIYAPNPLAILFLFGCENRFPVQITAREDTKALVIPKRSILTMLQMNSHILENYLNISADFAGKLSRKLHFMSFRTIRQKLAMYLLERTKTIGAETVILDRTKTALAAYFGVSRQSLERELANMRDDGLIRIDNKKIELINKNELIRLIRF